jgi:hypothetical protein
VNQIPLDVADFGRYQFGGLVTVQAKGFILSQLLDASWFLLGFDPNRETLPVDPEPIAVIALVRGTELKPVTQGAFSDSELFSELVGDVKHRE